MMKVISIDEQQLAASATSFLDTRAKGLILKWLQHIEVGCLIVKDGAETFCFGENESSASLCAHLDIHQVTVYREILLNGMVGAGEAYIRGTWSSPDLLKVIRVVCMNRGRLQAIDSAWSAFINQCLGAFWHRCRANSKTRARLNIAAHYDLGNDFFKLFLDETM
ncbi:MAG: class I SAM-dependent methyltransferase, partial [Cellvibrionaceae bacterium]|nr:class I SAM-dependent methyltransferase [Cellvibrionaceae bacterium]